MVSSDRQFSTYSINDAGHQGGDAGSTTGTALQIVTGSFSGSLYNPFDPSDYYKIYAAGGQQIKITLGVPSGVNYDLALLNPAGSSVATSTNGAGMTESIGFVATSAGYWYIAITWISGTGSGTYTCSLTVSAGQDVYDLDVGAAGDMTTTDHLPGLSLLSGWYSPVNSMREGSANAAFLLNLHGLSYQSYVGYLITVRYQATALVKVQALSNDVWVDVATMTGDSSATARSYSFVLKSQYLDDALPGVLGNNVQLRFAHAITVDTISALAYSYTTDFSSPAVHHNPGVALGTGWALDGAVANGTSGATLVVSVPLTRACYELQFTYYDERDGMDVQLYTSSGWQTIGTLHRYGSSAAVYLDMAYYYDSDPSSAGMNLLVRINGALYNLSSVTMTPALLDHDVGVIGDEVHSGQSNYLFGTTIYDNGEWSGRTTMDGRTVRTTTSTSANFLLNAPVSGQRCRIDIAYKTATAGAVMQWDGTTYHQLGTLIADGAWHLGSFWTLSGDYYDHPIPQGSFNNTIFAITSQGTTVDYIFANADSDQDTLVDRYEIAQGTSPLMADTDHDGLNDNVEPSYGTDPTDPDSDDDGLLDGSEQWSQTWSSEQFYRVPNGAGNSGRPCISITIPAMPLSRISSIKVHVGVITDRAQDIEIWMNKAGISPHQCLYYRAQSGANVFESFVPVDGTYTMAQYASGGTFNFYVADWNSAGGDGQVQYVRLQIDGTTNPLVADTDGDGILDGEEVNMGADGWVTNPVLTDTDSDGVNDRNEIIGNTLCGQKLDPTYKDTDGDGFNDNVDKYLGDMMLHVHFSYFLTWQKINNGDVHDIFFALQINNDKTLSTDRLYDVWTNQERYFSMDYYIDAPDDGTSMPFSMQAVADNAGTAGDDIRLDIESTSSDACDYPFTFYFSNGYTPYVAMGEDESGLWIKDMNTEAEVRWYVETVVKPKARTIVINSTDDSSGLYTAADGSYRYNADEQVYMLYVTTPGSSSHFVSGVNTIIVPRFLALESQLNNTLTTNPGSSQLAGGSFYATDASQASSSGHIVAVIEKSMSNSDAENLLYKLTHNAANERIGNDVVVPNVYLLHLPRDVQSRLPYVDLASSPTGAAPNYLSIGAVFEFVWNCLVSIGNTLSNLVTSLVQAGISYVCALSNAVTTVVNKIVDALNAFVQWAIELICDAFNALISAPLQALYDGLAGWAMGLVALMSNAAASIDGGTDNGTASLPIFQYIVDSDIFKVLTMIGFALLAVITAASFLGPFSFIGMLVAPFLVDLLISGMTTAAFALVGGIDVIGWIAGTIGDILGTELVGGMAGVMGAAIGTIGWIASLMSLSLPGAIGGFVWSTLGAILSWAGTIITDWTWSMGLNIMGLALALKGCDEVFRHPSIFLKANPTAHSILKGVTLIEGGISVFELTTTVASHE